MQNNPLEDFYRQKEIYITLPTQGRWLSEEPNLSADGELGIKPLSLNDEMLLNVPDSLYNGESIFGLIKSIAPDIVDPYELSMPDFDVILLASRAATYDKKMTVESVCPHCESSNPYEIDLPSVLSKVKVIGGESTFEMDGLRFDLKANTVSAFNVYNIKTIEQSQLLRQLGKLENDQKILHDEKYKKSLDTIASANIALIADAVVSITTPDNKTVTDKQQICDFLSNASRQITLRIEKVVKELNANGLDKSFTFVCASEECEKEFTGPIEFNPSFFFSNLSSAQKEILKKSNVS